MAAAAGLALAASGVGLLAAGSVAWADVVWSVGDQTGAPTADGCYYSPPGAGDGWANGTPSWPTLEACQGSYTANAPAGYTRWRFNGPAGGSTTTTAAPTTTTTALATTTTTEAFLSPDQAAARDKDSAWWSGVGALALSAGVFVGGVLFRGRP